MSFIEKLLRSKADKTQNNINETEDSSIDEVLNEFHKKLNENKAKQVDTPADDKKTEALGHRQDLIRARKIKMDSLNSSDETDVESEQSVAPAQPVVEKVEENAVDNVLAEEKVENKDEACVVEKNLPVEQTNVEQVKTDEVKSEGKTPVEEIKPVTNETKPTKTPISLVEEKKQVPTVTLDGPLGKSLKFRRTVNKSEISYDIDETLNEVDNVLEKAKEVQQEGAVDVEVLADKSENVIDAPGNSSVEQAEATPVETEKPQEIAPKKPKKETVKTKPKKKATLTVKQITSPVDDNQDILTPVEEYDSLIKSTPTRKKAVVRRMRFARNDDGTAVATVRLVPTDEKMTIESFMHMRNITAHYLNEDLVYTPVEKVTNRIVNGYSQYMSIIKPIRRSIQDGTFAFDVIATKDSQVSWVNSMWKMSEYLFENGILASCNYDKGNHKISAKVSRSEIVQKYITGGFLEYWASKKIESVCEEKAKLYGVDYEVYSNVICVKSDGQQQELDNIFRVGKEIFWAEIKSGTLSMDLGKYPPISLKFLNIPLDHFIFLASERTTEETKNMGFFQSFYVANIETIEEELSAMIDEAFREGE